MAVAAVGAAAAEGAKMTRAARLAARQQPEEFLSIPYKVCVLGCHHQNYEVFMMTFSGLKDKKTYSLTNI
jgi:hypothetical protein